MTTMVISPRAAYAQNNILELPQPGTMVDLSSAYVPLMVTGLSLHPENPLLIDFIVSTGNSKVSADQVKKESDRLIKYFLACLTIPENDQWVNLSPYEKDRIAPEDLSQTILGQDMLVQDYILKQLTASLIYPEKNLGKNFWDKVYSKAGQLYGTTQIPVNTFNKVWILPDTAKVYEHDNTVFVVKSHLKVMLDEDYLALSKHQMPTRGHVPEATITLASQVIREIILPAIEQEVNTGKNFSNLRQIYNSMILAVWFKKNVRQALLNQVYTDKSKVNGVNANDPAMKERIYKRYIEAYKKGVFNYIKEEVNRANQQVVVRKYFSGGLTPETNYTKATTNEAMAALSAGNHGEDFKVSGLTRTIAGQANAARLTFDDARQKMEEGGWGHLFDQWWSRLSGQEQKQGLLLEQVKTLDWKKAKQLHDELIVPGVPEIKVPENFEFPVERIGAKDEQAVRALAREKVLKADTRPGKSRLSKLAFILAAGGSGSAFESEDPKGYLPGTPFSQMPLYEGLVKKIKAAAKYYGHHESFPIVIMTSDITHQKTKEFFEDNGWFGMKDRIFLARQDVMPLFDANTNEPFLNVKGQIATGGTGHGDAFDDILVREDVSKFLDDLGVEVVQYMAVDNPLNPIVDERLIGYGQKTWDPASKDPRAHIALGVIPKNDLNDRLGNQILVTENEVSQWVAVGYSSASERIKNTVTMGDPSFRVVWRQSLKNARITPWRIDQKTEKDFEGNARDVKKIERASDDKPRRVEGPLVELSREDTFAPIKSPDHKSAVETPATSYLAQSNYWKKRLQAAVLSGKISANIGVEIAAQEAFFMSDEQLAQKLRETGIADQITRRLLSFKADELGGFLITEDWKVQFIGTHDPRLYFLNRQGALAPKEAQVVPGGIDLASRHLNMESSGQGVNITFDPLMIEQFKRGEFSGVRIQIIDVVPVDLMPLLGLKEERVPQQLVA